MDTMDTDSDCDFERNTNVLLVRKQDSSTRAIEHSCPPKVPYTGSETESDDNVSLNVGKRETEQRTLGAVSGVRKRWVARKGRDGILAFYEAPKFGIILTGCHGTKHRSLSEMLYDIVERNKGVLAKYRPSIPKKLGNNGKQNSEKAQKVKKTAMKPAKK